MEVDRKPFQGIWNIIRFNWHFYLIAFLVGFLSLGLSLVLTDQWLWASFAVFVVISIPTLISLLVSYYVYDLSDLYQLKWLDKQTAAKHPSILNVNAGFDETTQIISQKFDQQELAICDFFDPEKHTEVSIKRARRAYPMHPGTKKIQTNSLPYKDQTYDIVCVIFAAHEIRNFEERVQFFKELRRVLRPTGKLFITEHLRDGSNFFAYTVGFLHFYSRNSWMKTFRSANLKLKEEIPSTPFVNTFILQANGATS